MSYVDVRSDTVTVPTPEMREAMLAAPVGDDVYEEDPTINALEEEVADLLGKEAAIYCATGTMTNQIGIWASTREADEVIMERECHVYNYEAGAPAILSRVLIKLLDGERGVMTADQIEEAIVPDTLHTAPTSLVCIENTHNKRGGTLFPLDEMKRIGEVCHRNGLKLHLDGARLWNATAATGVAERDYAATVDSLSVCFSKGLGAPVGSALCGSRDLITVARKKRKMIGGGWRQAGIIAAGALYALRNHRNRLTEDHANAKRLADGLRGIPGITINPDDPETNILMIDFAKNVNAKVVSARLKEHGVLISSMGPHRLRAVTHLGIDKTNIDTIIAAFAAVMKDIDAIIADYDTVTKEIGE